MSESSQTRPEHQLPTASLGRRRETPFTYTPSLLEAIPCASPRPHLSGWVSLRCERFTSLCPVTGQPDWATLTINYMPRGQLVESKSLKEYLGSFRMHGDFHEDVCQIIVDDLVACIQPFYLELTGHFDARGSIAIWPYVQYACDDPAAQDLARQRLVGYQPGHAGSGR